MKIAYYRMHINGYCRHKHIVNDIVLPLFHNLTNWWSRVQTIHQYFIKLPSYLQTWYNGLKEISTWRHQIETLSALVALCEGNPPVTGGFPSQRPVTRGFDVFFGLCLNKRLTKQSRRRWFETPPRSLWRHRNELSVGRYGNLSYEFTQDNVI